MAKLMFLTDNSEYSAKNILEECECENVIPNKKVISIIQVGGGCDTEKMDSKRGEKSGQT
jgi:hypothetical protein